MNEAYNPHPGGIRRPRYVENSVTCKTRSGQTLFTRGPIPDPRPEFNGTQKSMRRILRRAVTYAEFACNQAVYQCKAVGTGNTPYHLAVADYLEKPKVLDIDLRDWTEGSRQKIRIRATDDFIVLSVRLAIREGDCILEEGEAVQSETDRLLWTYTTRTSLARKPGICLDASAYDLPGNVGSYSIELR